MTPSLAGFIEFVNAQPADRGINNRTWSSCAVGDYAREVLNHNIIATTHSDSNLFRQVRADKVVSALWSATGTGEACVFDDRPDLKYHDSLTLMDHLNEGRFHTYGGLQKYLVHNR